MAELTDPATGRGGNGPRGDAMPVGNGAVDPRAVRVRLAPASQTGDEPAIRVSPVGETLRMTNPTVGRGPLGGAAVPALPGGETGHRDAGVFAQGQRVEVDGEPSAAFLRVSGSGRFVLDEDGVVTRVVLEAAGSAEGGIRRREVLVDGFRFEVDTESERIAVLRERATRGRGMGAQSGPLEVRAIIPGKVASISVTAGDAVTAGQQLLVIEAMKMQNELRAPRDGTISRVGVAPGENIDVGDLLVVIG